MSNTPTARTAAASIDLSKRDLTLDLARVFCVLLVVAIHLMMVGVGTGPDGDLVAQLNKALANIGEVLKDAEMEFSDIVQLTFFVCSRDDYAIARREFGEVWRNHGGKHYPAMAVLMVAGLFDPHALIEVQGIAAAAG